MRGVMMQFALRDGFMFVPRGSTFWHIQILSETPDNELLAEATLNAFRSSQCALCAHIEGVIDLMEAEYG